MFILYTIFWHNFNSNLFQIPKLQRHNWNIYSLKTSSDQLHVATYLPIYSPHQFTPNLLSYFLNNFLLLFFLHTDRAKICKYSFSVFLNVPFCIFPWIFCKHSFQTDSWRWRGLYTLRATQWGHFAVNITVKIVGTLRLIVVPYCQPLIPAAQKAVALSRPLGTTQTHQDSTGQV